MPRTDGEPPVPDQRGGRHWFEDVADFLGPAYLRYSFTRGTAQEVQALVELAALGPASRVLDVGCGPGRHALGLARRDIAVTGIDISATFVGLARAAAEEEGLSDRARFEVADARLLGRDPAYEACFDAVYSLCQGAFGLAGGLDAPVPVGRELDEPILAAMARALVPGGRLVVSAFSAYFQLRHLEAGDTFDAARGVNHERTELRDLEDRRAPADLWTSCFTPRELRLLARAVGLDVVAVLGATPGSYGRVAPAIEHPELLLVARRPEAAGP